MNQDLELLQEYIQMLVTTRAQLEVEVVKLRRELNALRTVQTQEKEEIKETL